MPSWFKEYIKPKLTEWAWRKEQRDRKGGTTKYIGDVMKKDIRTKGGKQDFAEIICNECMKNWWRSKRYGTQPKRVNGKEKNGRMDELWRMLILANKELLLRWPREWAREMGESKHTSWTEMRKWPREWRRNVQRSSARGRKDDRETVNEFRERNRAEQQEKDKFARNRIEKQFF